MEMAHRFYLTCNSKSDQIVGQKDLEHKVTQQNHKGSKMAGKIKLTSYNVQ